MITRHDVSPLLYTVEAHQYTAVVVVQSHLEEVLIGYDKIDQLLQPSLIAEVQLEPTFDVCTDGMGCLIRPSWILTAAHVAEELPRNHCITIRETSHAMKKVFSHPEYKDSSDIADIQHNIALIQLEEGVSVIAPLPLYSDRNERYQITTLVGSGDYGNGLIGPDQADGKLRKATNRIESVSETHLILHFDAPPNGTDLEGVPGPGGSGGPALLKVGKEWAIAGIHSGQDSKKLGEGRYGVSEYYTRVSSYRDWIESTIRENISICKH